jgi:hypothetical protein
MYLLSFRVFIALGMVVTNKLLSVKSNFAISILSFLVIFVNFSEVLRLFVIVPLHSFVCSRVSASRRSRQMHDGEVSSPYFCLSYLEKSEHFLNSD